jgi:hypothetical protein
MSDSQHIPIPVHAHTPHHTTAPERFDESELTSFVERAGGLVKDAPANDVANSVVVTPGGGVFKTITDAINSISDAGAEKEYVISAGPGTYTEQVILKPWLHLTGVNGGGTIVTWPAPNDAFKKGTIVAAANASVMNMEIISTGTAWGCWMTGVDCGGANPFSIQSCNIALIDMGVQGCNMYGVSVDYNAANSGNSVVYLYYAIIKADATAQNNNPIGVISFGGAFTQAVSSKVIAASPSGWSWGMNSALNSTVIAQGSYISAQQWALVINQPPSVLKAQSCQINGPVGPGVVVTT